MNQIAKPMAQPAAMDHGMRFGEFVGLVAGLMALGAVAIDAMLPALPAIGRSLDVADGNARQWIITAYILGNGVGQGFYGLVADRYGRRPVLLAGVAACVVLGTLAAFADSFALLLLLRALHGLAAASTIVVRSVVRDCYSGATMARVMSLTFIVFLAVPVLAPSLGQLILAVADWRGVFGFFGLFGAVMLLWTAFRLPETLDPAWRRPITTAAITDALRLILLDRTSSCYTLALTCMVGSIFGFIGSIQQIFADCFHAPQLMTVGFALCAGSMGVMSYLNSRLVGRFGVRGIAQPAVMAFILVALLHLGVAWMGRETIWSFLVLQSLTLCCFSLVVSNCGALAMEPLGAVAGMAASIQGVISTLGGALAGAAIGQGFDGTTIPLVVGAVCCGLGALACMAVAERGRLFRHELD
jgi:DHA1 family bicyclomycin/chloramphenicol resistance-like MFS transporter